MSKENHSPLPWKQNGASICDAEGQEVAETWGNQFAKMVIPDAAFIVEAANSHDKLLTDRDALLQALNGVLREGQHDGPCTNEYDDSEPCTEHIRMLRERTISALKAIAQAEKEG